MTAKDAIQTALWPIFMSIGTEFQTVGNSTLASLALLSFGLLVAGIVLDRIRRGA